MTPRRASDDAIRPGHLRLPLAPAASAARFALSGAKALRGLQTALALLSLLVAAACGPIDNADGAGTDNARKDIREQPADTSAPPASASSRPADGGTLSDGEAGAAPAPPASLSFDFPEPRRNPSIAGPNDPRAISFVSYNLWNYLSMDRRVDGELRTNHAKPEHEIQALLSMIHGCRPDILGVSEIGTLEDVIDLQSRLAAIGYELRHITHVDGPDPVRNLALLSRFPIIDTNHQTDLHFTIGHQRLAMRRGLLDATVRIKDGYDVRFIGGHFKSKLEVDYADQEEIRRNEAELTRQHIENILGKAPKTRLILFGDFNDTKQNPAFRTLKGPGGRPDSLNDLWLRDQFGFRWTHHWGFADTYSRIDYIFYSRAMAPDLLMGFCRIHHSPEWRIASDHRPLVVFFIPNR